MTVIDMPSTESSGGPSFSLMSMTPEPKIHGLIGAQFGDLEFDVGKSVRWSMFFQDDTFIMDVNLGDQRYWVVNWTASFPTAEHTVTGRNFFVTPAEWRKEQFAAGDAQFHYADTDWVLFIDAHEGLSMDNRSLPDDYVAAPFLSFIYREVQRAVDAGSQVVYLPFFVYLKYSDLQNVTYFSQSNAGGQAFGVPPVQQPLSVPWYLPFKSLPRLIQVSALRNTSFDWASIDQPLDYPPATQTPAVTAYLTPSVGTVSTPDPGPAPPAQCTLVFKVRGPTSGQGVIAGQWTTTPQLSWRVSRSSINEGWFPVAISNNGTNSAGGSGGGDGVPTTSDDELALAMNFATDTTSTWRKGPSGWANVNSDGLLPAVDPFNSTGPVVIGNSTFQPNVFQGRIYYVELRSGLDPSAGSVIWRFDATEYPGTGTSYADPRGRTWTLTSASAITPSSPAVMNVKTQIISYAYAHWNIQDIPPGQTTVPALDANNDDGWRMRNLMSRIRPAPGVPFGTTWQAPNTDPASLAGPWCVDATLNIDPALAGTVEESGHTPTNSATAGVRVPLYDQIMRINLRDGLWYERGASGNIPLTWDSTNQVWVPAYDPDQWADKGVDATVLEPPAPSKTALRLTGATGTYASTSDANYLDFADAEAFTLVAVMSADSWHPTARRIIVSKWLPPSQCSWYWALEPGGGMVLVVSRDGAAPIEFPINLTDGAAFNVADGTALAIAASFATNLVEEDECRFWMCPTFDLLTWQQVGPTIIQPNPGSLNLFASTTEVQIGAYGGNQGNLAGYFRLISVRQGIGEQNDLPYVGGTEVALMRGDVTANPSYDRYGNLWVNHGGWSYANMPGLP